MDENFQDLLNQNKKPERLKPGTLLEGEVVEIREGAVVVNAGLKSEGVIPIEQFTNKNGELEVSEGDIVEVALDSLEDGLGETLLSRERARNIRTWTRLEEACESGDIVKGFLLNKVKGGFIVDLDGISAFLPGSLVDMRPMRDLTYLEGKELEFKIIKLDRNRSNVVVSRRAVLESEHGAGADEVIAGKGLAQISDIGELAAVIAEVLANSEKQVAQYRAGKKKVFGYFVGQVMKATQGRANPAEVNRLLKESLEKAD